MSTHKLLYLGTDPSRYVHAGELVHYPIIRTVARKISEIPSFTHYLFTSPNAVRHWVSFCQMKFPAFAIGPATKLALKEFGIDAVMAPFATQEGMIALFQATSLQNIILLWPRSAHARPLLADYLTRRSVSFFAIDLYETIAQRPDPIPDLQEFDEIVFTSPTTVDAFLEIFGPPPEEKKLTMIGPVTAQRAKFVFWRGQICILNA